MASLKDAAKYLTIVSKESSNRLGLMQIDGKNDTNSIGG